MWTENANYKEDLELAIRNTSVFGEALDGKRILVTGATGLVGQNLVNALLYYGSKTSQPPVLLLPVRNMEKAQKLYEQQIRECGEQIVLIPGDVTVPLEVDGTIDYIVHGASQTESAAFVKKPVETIETALAGTKNMLELAKNKGVKSFVYLSSMEAYGSPTEESLLSENAPAYFDSMAVRSSYPEGKRICETLCAAYAAEYDVPAKVVRLAQTFGPGVAREDVRVFADFARKALISEDIVMLTMGDSCRMYLYTMDAATAILTVLLKGENGVCYNAANKETYCSIREMAEMVSEILSDGKSKVVIKIDEETRKKYPPAHKLKLDTSKLENLGWKATCDLEEMYKKMVQAF